MRSYGGRPQVTRAAAPAAPGAALRASAIQITTRSAPAALSRAALLGSVWLGALAMLAPNTARAVDGTWNGPGAEWTVGTNWTSIPANTVPDNAATFTNNSAPTSVTISNSTSINTIEFAAGAPAYSLTVRNGATFTITASITMVNLLILSWLVFGITMRGNVLLFFLMTIIFLITILGLGLFISTISKTQQQASFTTAFFVLPPFLFLSGYAFPIENMPEWIKPLTYAIPLRYYLVIMRGIFLKGVGLEELWPQLLAMLGLGLLIFAASFLRFRKNLE